jgi:hypothetical protein
LEYLFTIERGTNYNKADDPVICISRVDKAYQLLAHGQLFSPASCTTKTGRHDIAEILLKVALKHQKSNQNQNLRLAIKLISY